MSFYETKILPHVINCACGMKAVDLQRAKVVPLAQGEVLELGIGTGLNAKHYDAARVSKVIGIDPSQESWQLAQPAIQQSDVAIEYRNGRAVVRTRRTPMRSAAKKRWPGLRIYSPEQVLFTGCQQPCSPQQHTHPHQNRSCSPPCLSCRGREHPPRQSRSQIAVP